MTHRHPLILLVVAATVAGALAGCGGGDGRSGATTTPATAAGAPARAIRFLDRHALALQLGNGFRSGLDRLAVMDQPREGATDLGQDLPAGLLRDVRCTPATARPAGARPWPWRCRVRWETVAGGPRTTRYAVRLLPTGCFAAGARPALPQRHDPTINTFAEHPLNTIISIRRGC
jgi:hypothetical protein